MMMDSCMAFLVMELTDFIYTPMSIDINVSFLAAGNPAAKKEKQEHALMSLRNTILTELLLAQGILRRKAWTTSVKLVMRSKV